MFNFFIQNRNKEMQSLAEIIAVDMAKLNLSRLAIEKAMLMIAKAIAKSDILIQTESKDKRRQEYRLNIPECAFGIVSLRYMTPPEQSYPLTASK